MNRKTGVQSFRRQMAQSIAELQGIMDKKLSPTGNGQLTARTVRIAEPTEYDARSVRRLRAMLGLSQSAFASLLGVSAVLVRFWERGLRRPSPIARRLLDQIREHPEHFTSLFQPAPLKIGRRNFAGEQKHRLAS